jgi:hypothetical protein
MHAKERAIRHCWLMMDDGGGVTARRQHLRLSSLNRIPYHRGQPFMWFAGIHLGKRQPR